MPNSDPRRGGPFPAPITELEGHSIGCVYSAETPSLPQNQCPSGLRNGSSSELCSSPWKLHTLVTLCSAFLLGKFACLQRVWQVLNRMLGVQKERGMVLPSVSPQSIEINGH